MVYFNDDSSATEEEEIQVDIQALAEKVYELLKQDIRLTKERLGGGAYGSQK